MDKERVIETIQEYLDQLLPAADEEGAAEIARLKVMYRFLPKRKYGPDDMIVPAALVELSLHDHVTFCFVAPQGGGLVTRVGGQPVQVVTPQSPLGEALLGKKVGDVVKVELRGGMREYRVLSVQ